MDIYERQGGVNSTLLELAKHDFNLVQSVHQTNIRNMSRWEPQAMQNLPEYMKVLISALFKAIEELASDILNEKDMDVLLYLKNEWAGLCKAYLMEAERCGRDVGRPIAGPSHPTVDVNRTRPSDAMDP
ncbi:hypothetical protein QJS10_CPA09g00773 [Acorus calamus]|uniref:Terpene synthase metal-binding domain-containing protein n=1 Tax=Acorus calamus TaxID=4465 RepID=A0AAV9E2X4_ACOCL|nr:hypothetical protein QJS10_CPA09g00773 [Acorus calamus]